MNLKRYHCYEYDHDSGVEESPYGDWVRYSDIQPLLRLLEAAKETLYGRTTYLDVLGNALADCEKDERQETRGYGDQKT